MEDAKAILGLIIVLAVGAGVSVAAHTLGDGQYVTLDSVCGAHGAQFNSRFGHDSSETLKTGPRVICHKVVN